MAARRVFNAGVIAGGERSGAPDAAGVVPSAARKAGQMQPTQPKFSVLLVGADHVTCQWLGLRALLQEQPDLRVLAEVRQAGEALHVATAEHPDHILIDAAVDGMGLVPLVRQVRRASLESRVVVIGTKEGLRRDTLLQLVEQGARGYLLWEALGEEAVVRSLATVHEDGLLVGHRAVLDELLATPERRGRPRGDEPDLTDDEQAVLALLVGDLTQSEIAETLHMSEVTVKRIVAALRAKFGVRTTNALCWRAGRLGFVPLPHADDGATAKTPFLAVTGNGL